MEELQVQEDTFSQKNKPESDWGECPTHLYICVYICARSFKQVYMYNTHTHKNILMYKVTSSVFFEIEC